MTAPPVERLTRTWWLSAMAGVLAASACLPPLSAGTPTAPEASEARRATTVSETPVDGGPDFYRRFGQGLPAAADFFPLAVWYESVTSVTDTARDKAAGLNTYVELTENSDTDLIRRAGMHAIHGHVRLAGTETVGWLLADEVDMWAGAGDDAWTGSLPGQGAGVCRSSGSACGYDVQRQLLRRLPKSDGRLRYANYGKGVTFWHRDDEAAIFVNEFQDVVSADNYWFTDRNICGAGEGGMLLTDGASAVPDAECHLAANYGRTVDRLRELVRPAGSKVVWGFVEVGHPFSEDDWPTITPAQIRAAVWSSILHGARGIVYFNHSFGGPLPTQHALREAGYAEARAMVTRVNKTITDLAGVLNSPSVEGLVSTRAAVDVMVKRGDNGTYVFAGSRSPTTQTATLRLRCIGTFTAEVLDEDRTVTVSGGELTDTFADGNAVHIYRLPPDRTCDPPS